MKRVWWLIFSIIVAGCGYKPIKSFAKESIKDPVYIYVNIRSDEPKYGIYIYDEFAKLISERLNLKLTKDKKEAKSKIDIIDYSISVQPLNYDENGYVIRYGVGVSIKYRVKSPKKSWQESLNSYEEVGVKSTSIQSYKSQEEAIKEAIDKALDRFLYHLTIR